MIPSQACCLERHQTFRYRTAPLSSAGGLPQIPTVFLSYSRADLSHIEQLEAQLKSHPEIAIWRDQEKIYGGQKWPKVLGEAIANQDVFLLAWSKNSAASHFVEFEWTTAIALKKTVVPCLLDSTPLPPSLRATHAIPVADATKIIVAMSGVDISVDTGRRTQVIRKLNGLTVTEEKAVLEQAKTIFAQQQWTVQGNVYQASGDIHIHNEPSTPPGTEKAKPLVEKWQTWVAIVGGILVAILAGLQIQERVWPPQPHDNRSSISTEEQTAQFEDQPMVGTIFGEGEKRLSGVLVKLPEFKKSVMSDKNGRYEFIVKARHGQQIELLAEKNDYESMERFVSLGNAHNDFTMQRTRR